MITFVLKKNIKMYSLCLSEILGTKTRKEHPDSEHQFLDHTKSCAVGGLNPQHSKHTPTHLNHYTTGSI